jgi:hypothetical protein
LQEKDQAPYVNLYVVVRDRIRRVNDKRGEYLELIDCVVVSNRFYYIEVKDVLDRTKFTDHLNLEIRIKPRIQAEFK